MRGFRSEHFLVAAVLSSGEMLIFVVLSSSFQTCIPPVTLKVCNFFSLLCVYIANHLHTDIHNYEEF